jgi:hypothetical protein
MVTVAPIGQVGVRDERWQRGVPRPADADAPSMGRPSSTVT